MSAVPPRILLIRMSSLGDIIHTLPAVSDLRRWCPDVTVDWVVEEAYADVPAWHPAVRRVIPVALRKWRHRPMKSMLCRELDRFISLLRQESYTHVVDVQGLLKSAVIARCARGPCYGPGPAWARERWATWLYQHTVLPPPAPSHTHVIERSRALLATLFGYTTVPGDHDFAIQQDRMPPLPRTFPPYWVFLTGTTWPSKLWPVQFWVDLVFQARQGAIRHILLPWHTAEELERVQAIVRAVAARVPPGVGPPVPPPHLHILPRLPLGVVSAYVAVADGVVGLDSGLSHLAAALGRPGTTLFGASDATWAGVHNAWNVPMQATYPCSPCNRHRCPLPVIRDIHPPCYHGLAAEQVGQALFRSPGHDGSTISVV
jgi:heptosyltransferase-1